MAMSEFRVVSISQVPNSDDVIRRSTRVLLMVHELHKAGYQRLRIAPFVHEIGTWRCPITNVGNINPEDDMPINWEWHATPQYSSDAGDEYFDWKDVKGSSARQLAQKFVEHFPKIIELSVGQDWGYAGWLASTLGLAEANGSLPILRGHDTHDQKIVRVPKPPLPRN